jgi:NTP pyrophosphatase (non-canonical NTP hydrolase)
MEKCYQVISGRLITEKDSPVHWYVWDTVSCSVVSIGYLKRKAARYVAHEMNKRKACPTTGKLAGIKFPRYESLFQIDEDSGVLKWGVDLEAYPAYTADIRNTLPRIEWRLLSTTIINSETLHDLQAERNRQDDKWGKQDHKPLKWQSILGEEFGEVCKAINEHIFNGAPLEDYYTELVQVAAVAIAAMESAKRNELK